jgi:FADH2 O2-dependent halogenase
MLQLPHAAAFVDPLYSSGMSVLAVALDLIAEALLEAVADDDYARERFQFVEDVVNTGLDHCDLIVSRSFDAFASYETWDAWNRIWALGGIHGAFGMLTLLIRYLKSGDRLLLDKTTEPGRVGVLGSHVPEVIEATRASAAEIDAATAGRISHADAGRLIFERLCELGPLPSYLGLGDPRRHAMSTFTLPGAMRYVLRCRLSGSRDRRDGSAFPLTAYALQALGFVLEATGGAWRRNVCALRDVFFAGNKDWRHVTPAVQYDMPPTRQGSRARAAGGEAAMPQEFLERSYP